MASSSPTWVDLQLDITAAIFRKLGHIEMLTAAQFVCKKWYSVCLDPSLWRSIHIRHIRESEYLPYINWYKMWCNAVDRSQGQLVELKIEDKDVDVLHLLRYLCQRIDRCSQLRRLQVICISVSYMTSYDLMDAVKNFHLLEELHLYYTPIDTKGIETIGQSCPLLKSFTCNKRWCTSNPYVHVLCNYEARAITLNMPGLRHLRINGSKMTNRGLQIILNGCPHLESLDLRQCFHVNLDEEIGRLCREKIRDLKRPDDSTDDYPVDIEAFGLAGYAEKDYPDVDWNGMGLSFLYYGV